MANLTVNSVVLTVIALAIGIVLIGDLLVPQAVSVMDGLKASETTASWASLIGVVVVVWILGLVVLAINQYTSGKD